MSTSPSTMPTLQEESGKASGEPAATSLYKKGVGSISPTMRGNHEDMPREGVRKMSAIVDVENGLVLPGTILHAAAKQFKSSSISSSDTSEIILGDSDDDDSAASNPSLSGSSTSSSDSFVTTSDKSETGMTCDISDNSLGKEKVTQWKMTGPPGRQGCNQILSTGMTEQDVVQKIKAMALAGTAASGYKNGLIPIKSEESNLAAGLPIPKGVHAKHPLQHTWSLWYLKVDKNKTWEENLLPILHFNSVEDFWAGFNHLMPPSRLPVGADYLVFHHGIKPMWEDPYNCRGGRWLLSLTRDNRHHSLDRLWQETLMCLVGEAFENSEDVRGAVVNLRSRGDKLALWTADARRAEANVKIAKKWKDRLEIDSDFPLGFEAHRDSMAKIADPGAARFLYSA